MPLTLTPRTAGLMVALALATGWMGASVTQRPEPAQSSRGSGIPRPIGSSENTVPRAETLRQRLVEPPLPSPGRNPFVYGSRAPMRPTSYRDRDVARMAAPPVAVELPPQRPIFKLSGIASTADAGTTVLTAIIIDNGSMVFAKAGDKLSNGYSVVSVGETSATLVDAAGLTQTVRLP